ncbi:MAG TPA: hypothetical protein GX739_08215 [Firmicutes bacterium]|nr:hypothetical protein [Bacillota bacterium]
MSNTRTLAIILIGIGVLGLLINANILSVYYWNIIWPIGIIFLGVAVYKYLRDNPDLASTDWGEKVLAGLLVAGTMILVFLAIFGIIGPILALIAVIIVPVVLLKLGIVFLAVLIPIAIILAPIILILWLLALLL